ncbi:MAG: NAD(P)H-dependent glycerol-3-phosphate dehydrogenase [Ignavibacteriales bacterium]|nr:Glycerol-3-phosphate dehydrogenase [NAD(P)+] [Ignavibacteriaceae bacterium]QOJ28188.1 MAG: NAD(P)H-dependent glycerol-3-phosphate dehydrogenase [Ignavibacteriales bacterium]
MKTAVLGAGAWGTTLAIVLHNNSHQVTLWEYKTDYAKILAETRSNPEYLPGIPLPVGMTISNNLLEAVADKELIVLAVPSQFLRSVMVQIPYEMIKKTILVSVSKGIEKGTLMTMSQMLHDVYKETDCNCIGVLSGPSHAEEVSVNIPTTVVAASADKETSRVIQHAFSNSYFRVYNTTDIIGVELGGAFKNVIAIGAGIIDGLKFGDNTKAAIMTRGIAEISRLGIAMGSRPETFAGLSGIGDLIVTCMSRHSRNRYVGEKIGSGMKLKEVLAGMNAVAEGVETSRSARMLAQKYEIDTPITREVYNILFEDKDPRQATFDLMTRDKKEE